MAIHEVTYYQAKCDACAEISDDYGDHSAWSNPQEVFDALPDWYTIRTITGQEFDICDNHEPAGIQDCAACNNELDAYKWRLRNNNLTQKCGHCKFINNITLETQK